MKNAPPLGASASYGDNCAEFYDEIYQLPDPRTIAVLAGLTGHGRALDLGIGTGRVALPLRARGVAISGIEASHAMFEQFQRKPMSEEVPVVMGNFADCEIDGPFSLVFALVS